MTMEKCRKDELLVDKKELSCDEIKQRVFEVLCYIDDVCQRNNIVYYIDSGTLLGAVRHKGFIPWDDDVDILVDRADYKRFIDVINADKSHYKVLSMHNTKNYHYLFAKVVDTDTELIEEPVSVDGMGAFVDVFPIDHLPTSKFRRRMFQRVIHLYRMALTVLRRNDQGDKPSGAKQKVVYFLFRRKGWRKVQLELDRMLTRKKDQKTKYKGNVVCSCNPYRDVETRIYGKPVKVQFESREFNAPCKYKEYLTILYGDYMQLPPEDKRVSNHDFKVYLRD